MSDLSMAITLLEQGQREEAVRELEAILRRDIDNIAAWRLLAHALDDPREVKECYEHVLRLNPYDPEAIEALRNVEVPEPTSGVPPFFSEDLVELESLPAEPSSEPPLADAISNLLPEDESEPESAPASPRGWFENDTLFFLLILAVIGILVVIVLLVTTPQGVAFLQSILNLFKD
ncbi:MAG TPA: hypothetical protein DEQ80_03045 [Anaerolinea thermolimosa]|uniref:Tetratricopeptide repeat protein n=1 Tax=Anaerolinea thermolimosa TaxID=229919 RepID=A0A3D1JEF3_9CHLR|nr:hypothetical protein [Anaerolinea thermolimosa]GAP05589.1 tetratricopeptide repeat [Anaerolinea thermolimosa]HCE16814.1 hypothetical protein [Anaerolinea thermolimosa]